jgi:ATP-dependent DNA helicase PIF1
VVVIKSVDTGVGIQKVTPDQCDTVQNLTLCIGAKAMLTQNIWVGLGLANGITGTVEDVVWKEHADIKKDQPQALLIVVDGYSGPALYTQQDGRKVIPVFSILREWEGARGSCSRRQFPVTLAFALTVHNLKSQGLTLNRVVLDIKDKDNTAGLTYVTVSRVKKLSGIMFECGFNTERFQLSTRKVKEARQEDFVRRQQQLLANNFS